MFDIGWTELLLIGLVALIVVGPNDLPKMFRSFGQFTGKMKRMAREFTQAMEDAADDTGVREVSKTIRDVSNPKAMGLDKIKDAINVDDFPEGSATRDLAEERKEAAKKLYAEALERRKADQEATAAKSATQERASDMGDASTSTSAEASLSPDQPQSHGQERAKSQAKTTQKAKT